MSAPPPNRSRRRYPPRRHRCAIVTLALPLTIGALSTAPAGAATGQENVQPAYVPPVDAPVIDPFRAPEHPYGPGNRGLEYDTEPGTDVVAAGAGTVVFAGQVAGELHVTILHDDGVRTTYSFLAEIAVTTGESVEQGAPVGTAGETLHFSVRIGDVYIDPSVLLGAVDAASVRLVPHDVALGSSDEAAATVAGSPPPEVVDAVVDRLGWDGGLASLGADALDWLRRGADDALTVPARLADAATTELLSPVGQQLTRLVTVPGMPSLASAVDEWARRRDDCTPRAEPVPPRGDRRVLVLVGGLGSSSEGAAVTDLDTVALGYDADDVVRFSYAGGVVPGASGDLAGLDQAAYGPEETLGDLRSAGSELAEVLRDVAVAVPGVPVDVVAHSQGGVVTRLGLGELATGGDPASSAPTVPLGTVVTLGTPHQGADLATLVSRIRALPGGGPALELVQAVAGLDIEPGSSALAQLSESSSLMDELRAEPLPPGVELVSIAARGDLVVPAPRSHLDGATNVVVSVAGLPTDHDNLPGSPAAGREIALALAGLAPSCEGLLEVLADHAAGATIGAVEDLLGLVPSVGTLGVAW